MRWTRLGLVGLWLLAGCFPIELDVKDGRILIARQEGFFAVDATAGTAIQLHQAASGAKPVFALFDPAGERILAVTEGSGAMMGTSHTFAVVSPADGGSKILFTGSNSMYAAWSPDGKYVAFTRVGDASVPPLDTNLPELHLLDVAAGTDKVLARNVTALFRWRPNSRAVLVFQIESKDEMNTYTGQLTAIDLASGDGTPLAAAMASDVFLDLSPDGQTVLFTAKAAGPAGTAVTAEEGAEDRLFSLSIGSDAVQPALETALYAIWSPDGSRVLLGTSEEDGLLTLQVADAGLTTFQTIASDAAKSASQGFGQDASIYPGWLDNDTVYYLAKTAVYGTAGANLSLVTVDASGQGRHSLQSILDAAAAD